MTSEAKRQTAPKRLPASDALKVKAMLVAVHTLLKHGDVKQYENVQASLLNNPQWRKAEAGRTR